MTNAAIYLHPNGFDTSGKELLGRHSAGESFLRGFLRHAEVDRFYFWNVTGRPQAEIEALVARIQPPSRPVSWIGRTARGALGQAGVLNVPMPEIDVEAWRRIPVGQTRYSLCGITHTTATARTMSIISNLLTAPLRDYDALICTSSAVRASVETQLDLVREHTAREFGPRRHAEVHRTTIPLGVNVEDFTRTPEHRKAWRERLDIPEDALVVLYVGRFEVRTKMNPGLMARALERAARRTGQPIYWVNSGWGVTPESEADFHAQTRALCPSVHYRNVDGRQPDVRFSIWSVGDIFLSLSDNIQETFGLTPVEAMAAGLPSVVSDWNGYKDTVRDGIDGFRVSTLAPAAGMGGDLAYWLANDWVSYQHYVGAAAQYTAVDLDHAERALSDLILNPDLRARQGASAQARAREVFDWKVIIPQYQALWAEQNARRAMATPEPARMDPTRPDPFTLFANYPTRHLTRTDVVTLRPGLDWPGVQARLASPLATYSQFNRPTDAEVETVIAHLTTQGPTNVTALRALVPGPRQNFLQRGLIWLMRHDVVMIRPVG